MSTRTEAFQIYAATISKKLSKWSAAQVTPTVESIEKHLRHCTRIAVAAQRQFEGVFEEMEAKRKAEES